MRACHVVFSMLLWLYMRCRSALFCNGAAPQCGWAGLMLKVCVGWRAKRASSIACLAQVFSCRIVLIQKALFDACSLLRIVKLLPAIYHTLLVSPQALQKTQFDALRPLLATTARCLTASTGSVGPACRRHAAWRAAGCRTW